MQSFVSLNVVLLDAVMLCVFSNVECHFGKCRYAECHMLSVVILNDAMLNVPILIYVAECHYTETRNVA